VFSNPKFPLFQEEEGNKVKVGVFDGHQIWGSWEFKGLDTYGILDENGKCISYVCLNSNEIRKDTNELVQLATRKELRGKGYATMILLFLMRKLGAKLQLSKNNLVSNDTRNMIWKGINQKRYKVFTPTGDEIDLATAKKILFTLGETKDEIVLSEELCDLELFSDGKKICPELGDWYLIEGGWDQHLMD
jgi:hypothetical protein